MSSSPTKIGLYGGSFDPIHNGHLILARDAMERLELDRVVFLPARISPHKMDRPPASAEARCQMVAESIKDEPGFFMDDREIRRDGASFTVDTVREFQEEFPGARLYYFIGDDNLDELHTWKEIDQLKSLVQFVILSRAGMPFLAEFPMITRLVEISSTEIRNRIARGQSVRYMVPYPACQVIKMLSLYKND
jgi:nicotinate-nucleotide adenylyltransferase